MKHVILRAGEVLWAQADHGRTSDVLGVVDYEVAVPHHREVHQQVADFHALVGVLRGGRDGGGFMHWAAIRGPRVPVCASARCQACNWILSGITAGGDCRANAQLEYWCTDAALMSIACNLTSTSKRVTCGN